MSDTQVGFVGLSNAHASMYLDSIGELPADLICACELTDEPLGYEAEILEGVPVYDGIDELLEDEPVDAVWMSLPNRDTPAAIELAAEYGVDVYAEKTLARTSADLEPAVEAAEDAGITVVAGYQNRGNAVPREIKSLVEGGFFGDLRAVEARMITSQINPYRDPSTYVYDAEHSRGGILQWLGCHTIDLLHFMLDDTAARVNAQVEYGAENADVEDGATVQFEMSDSGAIGTLQAGYYDREYDTYVAMHGSEGRVSWPGKDVPSNQDVLEMENYHHQWSVAPERELVYTYDDAPGYGGSMGQLYMGNFLDTVEGRDPDPELNATIHDSYNVLKFLDAVYESAEEDRWVTVE